MTQEKFQKEFFALAKDVFLAKLMQHGGECRKIKRRHYDSMSWLLGELAYSAEMSLLCRTFKEDLRKDISSHGRGKIQIIARTSSGNKNKAIARS